MAKVSAPFLSLGASGTVGDTLVAATWKGVKYMRQHVTPTDSQSDAQIAQRNLLVACTAFWRTRIATAALITAWNQAGAMSRKSVSGFNVFTSVALSFLKAFPTKACSSSTLTAFSSYWMLTVIGLGPLWESYPDGKYIVKFGPTPSTMIYHASIRSWDNTICIKAASPGNYAQAFDPHGYPLTGIMHLPVASRAPTPFIPPFIP